MECNSIDGGTARYAVQCWESVADVCSDAFITHLSLCPSTSPSMELHGAEDSMRSSRTCQTRFNCAIRNGATPPMGMWTLGALDGPIRYVGWGIQVNQLAESFSALSRIGSCHKMGLVSFPGEAICCSGSASAVAH